MGFTLAAGIIGVAIIVLLAFLVRQLRRARRLQDSIDYSRIREWKDDDE